MQHSLKTDNNWLRRQLASYQNKNNDLKELNKILKKDKSDLQVACAVLFVACFVMVFYLLITNN